MADYEEFKDADGNYIMCPICGSKEHTDGRCEQGTKYDKYEQYA